MLPETSQSDYQKPQGHIIIRTDIKVLPSMSTCKKNETAGEDIFQAEKEVVLESLDENIDEEGDNRKSKETCVSKLLALPRYLTKFIYWSVTLFLGVCPLPLILLGLVNRHNCPVNPNIPLFMIIFGFFSIIDLILRRFDNRLMLLLQLTITAFLLIWFLLGSIWVYGAITQMIRLLIRDGVDKPKQLICDPFSYWFTALFISLGYLVVLLMLLTFALVFLMSLFCPAKVPKRLRTQSV